MKNSRNNVERAEKAKISRYMFKLFIERKSEEIADMYLEFLETLSIEDVAKMYLDE